MSVCRDLTAGPVLPLAQSRASAARRRLPPARRVTPRAVLSESPPKRTDGVRISDGETGEQDDVDCHLIGRPGPEPAGPGRLRARPEPGSGRLRMKKSRPGPEPGQAGREGRAEARFLAASDATTQRRDRPAHTHAKHARGRARAKRQICPSASGPPGSVVPGTRTGRRRKGRGAEPGRAHGTGARTCRGMRPRVNC